MLVHLVTSIRRKTYKTASVHLIQFSISSSVHILVCWHLEHLLGSTTHEPLHYLKYLKCLLGSNNRRLFWKKEGVDITPEQGCTQEMPPNTH